MLSALNGLVPTGLGTAGSGLPNIGTAAPPDRLPACHFNRQVGFISSKLGLPLLVLRKNRTLPDPTAVTGPPHNEKQQKMTTLAGALFGGACKLNVSQIGYK
ncbi:protein of unknown function [Paraburkholderia dioscoreae]|uniref:Uncharacterized protein n=1 Tax=Paraburkholderia dioscoreae TaxID=2604047 RepID=A0A5Q4ZGH9_9BURK|nr:protein of unknown function [Paraburkholderia dioscoreae]